MQPPVPMQPQVMGGTSDFDILMKNQADMFRNDELYNQTGDEKYNKAANYANYVQRELSGDNIFRYNRTALELGAPTNPIEDFLRNPPQEQPAGPLAPQPQTSTQYDELMQMEAEKSKKNWARIQANAEQDGGLSASYGFASRIGDMADRDREEQSRRNEAGGRYFDKK